MPHGCPTVYSRIAFTTAWPYMNVMQTVIETEVYLRAAKDAGMSADEI